MKMVSCPKCGQPINLLGHQCPYCHIQIVGASGLSKLVREMGNTPYLAAGGLFLMAFFLCIVIFWKTGMLDSSELAAQYPVSPQGTAFLRSRGLPEKWNGKFIDCLAETGDAELHIKEGAGRSVTGTWNGSSIVNGKRAEDNELFWECSKGGRVWRFSARIHENSQLLTVAYQSITEDGLPQSGAAFLLRDGADQGPVLDAAAFSGIWNGLYSLGRETGVTTISVQEDKSGVLSGVWNGDARIAEGTRSGRFLQWECDHGDTHSRNIGATIGDGKKLVLIFSASEKKDDNAYCGSALYSKNP
jgi:hypothetical protein